MNKINSSSLECPLQLMNGTPILNDLFNSEELDSLDLKKQSLYQLFHDVSYHVNGNVTEVLSANIYNVIALEYLNQPYFVLFVQKLKGNERTEIVHSGLFSIMHEKIIQANCFNPHHITQIKKAASSFQTWFNAKQLEKNLNRKEIIMQQQNKLKI